MDLHVYDVFNTRSLYRVWLEGWDGKVVFYIRRITYVYIQDTMDVVGAARLSIGVVDIDMHIYGTEGITSFLPRSTHL